MTTENSLNEKVTISIILPCRNEEDSLKTCIQTIKQTLKQADIQAEIILSDSSTDKSPDIAKQEDIVVYKHDMEGYGRALLLAFQQAHGSYIFFADPDSSYDFVEIPRFLKYLDEGYDLVIGNRFGGNLEKRSMPWLHQYFGNPVLSLLINIFFRANITDAQSGMRACTKNALERMSLKTTGMEFASEMIIKASQLKLSVKEIPISYYPRLGQSKLRTFQDGFRHLRLIISSKYNEVITSLVWSKLTSAKK
jgi:glycosyltransferase involved in cell wall biosynthesis